MQGLSVLAIGDPHFRARYVKILDEFTKQTIDLVQKKTPDFVVVLGDTLHDHEQARESCHSRAVAWFKEMAKYVRVIVLIGNHDRPNNSHFQTDNHFFNGIKGAENITIVDKAQSITATKNGKSYRLVFVPYVPPGRFQEALDTLKVPIEKDRPVAIFAHQEIRGCKMGALESTVGDLWDAENPMLICGHIHEHQILADNMLYVGTPYQTTYAESTNKGVFMFTFSEQPLDIRRIHLNLRVKQSVTLTTTEFLDFKLPQGNLDLRILITGKHEAIEAVKQTSLYKELKQNPSVKLELRPSLDPKIKPNLNKKNFIEAFRDEVVGNDKLNNLFRELLSDIQ